MLPVQYLFSCLVCNMCLRVMTCRVLCYTLVSIPGITSDVLYPLKEQQEMTEHMPRADLFTLETDEGHDGFLIRMDHVSQLLLAWLNKIFPESYAPYSKSSRESESPVSVSAADARF